MMTSNVLLVSSARSFTWNICALQRLFSGRAQVLLFRKAQKLSRRVPRRLFQWFMTQEGPLTFYCCCVALFFPPRSPTLAVSLLRGLRMNSHCHVQGRVAQGQLIAFMIMISRQIYCACSEHIFQVLPTLLAQTGKMSLQLQAVTSCLSAGHTFWLIRVAGGESHRLFL